MYGILGFLFATVVMIFMFFSGIFPTELEIHILGLLKIKFKNKEKRSTERSDNHRKRIT